MYNITNYLNTLNEDTIALEGLFDIFSNSNKNDVMNSWYNKIFSGHSFMGNMFSMFNNVEVDTNYIFIKRIDYKKLLRRIKDTYGERNIEKIFIKNYNERDMKKFNMKRMSRQRMRIETLKTPLFFSLELTILFNDLYKKYREPAYGQISKQIYAKSWISLSDKSSVTKVPLTNLSRISLTLNDYQKEFIENYNVLKSHLNLDGFILTFEQGMGKTLTSVSLAECLDSDNVYIICPNTVQENWMLEIKKYYNKYSSDLNLWKKEVVKCADSNATKNAKFFIINNESISKMFPYIKSGNNMLIIDESQNFRNNSGKRVSELLELKDKLKPKNILAMSGTPIKASPNELVPIMRTIDPLFTEEAADIYNKCFSLDTTMAMTIVSDRFGKIIYRKTKELLDLPEKSVENIVYKTPDSDKYLLSNVKEEIRTIFDTIYSERLKENESLRKEFVDLINTYSTSSNEDKARYINWIIKTVNTGKDLALHELDTQFMETYLSTFILSHNINPKTYERITWLNTNFIKMKQSSMGRAIGEILPKRRKDMFISLYESNKEDILKRIMENNEKTIIFSQLKGVIDYICSSLNENDITTVKITGDVKDRLPLLMQFKEDDSTLVLCATSQSLGTGVTLIEASQMFFFGAPWRSADFDQCADRIHRIGQTVDVHIYNVLLDTGTKNLSSRMNDILNWSSEMFDSAIKQLEGDNHIMDVYANENVTNINKKLFYTKDSKIAGKGNFATMDLQKDINLGIGLVRVSNTRTPDKDFKRYPICTYTNHSNTPNLKIVKTQNKYYFYTKKIIKKDEELTVNYKEFDFEGKRDFVNESYIYNNEEEIRMSNSLDNFIATCESNVICNESFREDVSKPKKEKNDSDILPEIKSAFLNDELKQKVANMLAHSHEYKNKPNIEAGIKFANNYDWSVKDIALDKIEGMDKPLIKEKVFEIAKSMDGKDKNEWPIICCDKLHNISPQSKGKYILMDGNHRKGAMEFVGMKSTPCYVGKYNGGSEKDMDELTQTTESYQLTEEDEAVLESYLVIALEAKITKSDRAALPDSAFGIPSQRKFPLFLKTPEESMSHVRNAIKFFHFCKTEDRPTLAKNIMKAAKKYGIEIDEKSMIRKYL